MKKVISTENAPQAIGPYSQGVKSGNLIFTAGQISMNPKNGAMVSGGIEAETERVLLNIKAILEAAGSSLENVVKTTVFMNDLNEFTQMNRVYEEFFGNTPPARSTIQAKLPKGVKVEIEAIALVE